MYDQIYQWFNSKSAYTAAVTESRAAKRGIWQDKNPIEPHEFRKAKRVYGK